MKRSHTSSRRVGAGAVWACLAILVLAACGQGSSQSNSSSSSGPIIIGRAVAATGFMAAYDGPPDIGLQLWANQINNSGGLLGRKIKLVAADTKTDINFGATAADTVLDEGANILIASCDFDYGGPAALEAQKRGILAFSYCAGSLKFGPQGIGPLAFTMGDPAPNYGGVMGQWAATDKGWKTTYILEDPTVDFEKQEVEGFRQVFKKNGGSEAGFDTFQQTDQSIAAQLTRLKSVTPQPDFIYLASYGAGQDSALRQIRAAGLTLPVLSDGGFDGEVWKKAVPNVSNLYFDTYASIYGDDPRSGVNDFYKSYKDLTGTLPANSYPILGWAIGDCLKAAITRSNGTKGSDLQAQLEKFKGEPTIAGPITFTSQLHGDLYREMAIMQVQNGTTTFIKVLKPSYVPIVQT
ncbi:MAG TPA: ABC transporter substrate-binding protein [Edaphobacter sp.]